VIRDTPRIDDRVGEDVVVSVARFPSGEYEKAIRRWPSLAEDWSDVAHSDYCTRLDGTIKWMRGQGVPIRAVSPIVVADHLAWCAEHDEDAEEARAAVVFLSRRPRRWSSRRLANGLITTHSTGLARIVTGGPRPVDCDSTLLVLGVDRHPPQHGGDR